MHIRHFKSRAGYSKCRITPLHNSLVLDKKVSRRPGSFLFLEAQECSVFACSLICSVSPCKRGCIIRGAQEKIKIQGHLLKNYSEFQKDDSKALNELGALLLVGPCGTAQITRRGSWPCRRAGRHAHKRPKCALQSFFLSLFHRVRREPRSQRTQ